MEEISNGKSKGNKKLLWWDQNYLSKKDIKEKTFLWFSGKKS